MKLFLREQRPLIFVYIAQLLIITLVYWLDGYRNMSVSIYACLISGCLLAGYLIFRYVANRSFYKRLEQPHASPEPFQKEFSREPSQTPLAEALQQVLRSQFRHYTTDLHNYKHRIESHIQFINQWAHQMKTPISVIHLILQKKDDPDSTAIGDELDRLKKGLDLVLYSARLDTFERDFYVETLQLEQIVRSTASEQKRLFIRRRIFPSIDIEAGISITSDEKWLSFVLSQLITNAVRYTPSERGKLFFKGYRQDQDIVLEIRDEGIGIPGSDLPRVFDPYFTGENGRRYQESTGMGLYLVQQICSKLGHDLEIESTIGEGTTVRITFHSA
ncbi:Signal transduction histidine kinase [Paenibacillus uliginis N3/975]|uniref:histidine kinase n=1 Tax=Paenibacillus uliginis N3/975 TaxID=1313296 RepID=A0A1X7HQ31_9BACL|nr:HAMP domain-containing histidine kinase [Paenibacillus uliginis]SMF90768.1 Signal transduction histidine kinase [Paenibacillus uliginis N3/975]